MEYWSTSQLFLVAIMVFDPTHARGGTLDLLMTDVSDLVQVVIVAQIGNSDHSYLSAVIRGLRRLKLVCEKKSFTETSSPLEYCRWCNAVSALA